MPYIKTPITYEHDDSVVVSRTIERRIAMIDNFIELIVFSPKGSFVADFDFGFEYWNQEYSNVHFLNFNHGQESNFSAGAYNDVRLKECKESIENSIRMYEPQLKQVDVQIELGTVSTDRRVATRLISKYEVNIVVTGMLEDGRGTHRPYQKNVRFLMEPTVKRIKI